MKSPGRRKKNGCTAYSTNKNIAFVAKFLEKSDTVDKILKAFMKDFYVRQLVACFLRWIVSDE